VLAIISRVENKLGAWFRGQIVLSFTIGFTTWIALTLLGIPFAPPLAILAGILEIVPTIGPIIAGIPAVIVALSISPILAVVIIAVYIVIQMFENNILVPKIMERAVGLNPIVIIVGVMIGTKFMGVLGALLSVPFIATLAILFKNLKTNPTR
jgi:predicted PurR-regulated permease PerM